MKEMNLELGTLNIEPLYLYLAMSLFVFQLFRWQA